METIHYANLWKQTIPILIFRQMIILIWQTTEEVPRAKCKSNLTSYISNFHDLPVLICFYKDFLNVSMVYKIHVLFFFSLVRQSGGVLLTKYSTQHFNLGCLCPFCNSIDFHYVHLFIIK